MTVKIVLFLLLMIGVFAGAYTLMPSPTGACIQEVHQGPMVSRELGELSRDSSGLLVCSRTTS